MPAYLMAAFLSFLFGQASAAERPVMTESDVVFMYTAKDHAYFDRYGATWIAWGGGPAREGIHSTGSFWCLTAGARLLHEDPALREAVARDIEGRPIKVPWLLDHTHEGTPSWFGCTNHPAFRAHLREECKKAVMANPDGLHIDDPSGSYAPASYGGGCFCDYCMAGFREYLLKRAKKRVKALADPGSYRNFDYREAVRKHAATREEYLKVQDHLPLRREFLDYQLGAAVQNIRELRDLAREKLGPDMTMSVNAYYGAPGGHFLAFVPVITHMVAEAEHDAPSGVAGLPNVINGYRQAEAVGRPFAATASGGDWAYIKETGALNLVKIWIALSYACGQRLMVPHPEMQWCHTPELGTHWYQAPAGEFAPLYRFVRENARLFDGFVTVGPLAVPRNAPRRLVARKDRDALAAALTDGKPAPLKAGESVWVFPRARRPDGFVVHLLNVNYRQEGDSIRPQTDLVIELPAELAKRRFTRAILHSYDRPPHDLAVEIGKKKITVRVPELRLWSLLEFAN